MDYDDGNEYAPFEKKANISSPYFLRGNKPDAFDLKVGTLVKGAVIGFQDILFERNCVVSVRCKSVKGVVAAIKAEDFLAKMKRDSQTWQALNIFADEKDIDLEN